MKRIKPLTPVRRFFHGPGRASVLSTHLNKGVRLYISAPHFWDALFTYLSMKRFLRRAERTAELMKRINTLSSQCMQEWRDITFDFEYLGTDEAPQAQPESGPSHRQEEETLSHNADK